MSTLTPNRAAPESDDEALTAQQMQQAEELLFSGPVKEGFAKALFRGEFRKDIDPQVLIDMIFGPIYFRRLVGHLKLDQRFADEVVRHALAYVRAQPDGAGQ